MKERGAEEKWGLRIQANVRGKKPRLKNMDGKRWAECEVVLVACSEGAVSLELRRELQVPAESLVSI